MDLVVGQHDPGLGHVLNGVLGPASLACYPANSSGEMVPLQGLHVLDLEAVDEEVIEPDESERIFNFEAKDKSPDKVCSLLQSRWVFCVLASPHFHISAFQVETNLGYSQSIMGNCSRTHKELFHRSRKYKPEA